MDDFQWWYRRDEEGEFTSTGGRGCIVIDYVMGNEEVKEELIRLEVGQDGFESAQWRW